MMTSRIAIFRDLWQSEVTARSTRRRTSAPRFATSIWLQNTAPFGHASEGVTEP